MISAIIPTYRNPEYLDLCLKSATENLANLDDDPDLDDLPTEIIVVVDGFVEESQEIIEKYDGINVIYLPKNMGMQHALNIGVMNASNPYIIILNDDNVFAPRWDIRTQKFIKHNDMDNVIATIDQVEPGAGSIYGFISAEGAFKFEDGKSPEYWELWKSAETFPYEVWNMLEPHLKRADSSKLSVDDGGRIFPFIVSKRNYMMLGGFDTFYQSPFFCDLDWWLKAELAGIKFGRWYGMHWYHFGSMATKNRKDAEADMFKQSESAAAQTFFYKWGYIPEIVESALHHHNTKFPLHTNEIKGITFKLEN